MPHTYKYYVDDGYSDPDEPYAVECGSLGELDDKYVAEAAAEQWHNDHDGWEAQWPVTIVLVNADGSVRSRHKIDRRMDPYFVAV